MHINSDVLNFISRFNRNGNNKEVIDTFTCGCCYWFAAILHLRFPNSTIMYDEVANHFGTYINSNIYDITGDATNDYQWTVWDEFSDELERKRIISNCIQF